MTDQELIEAVLKATPYERRFIEETLEIAEPIIAKREREKVLREFLACIVASDNDPAAFNIRSVIRAFARAQGVDLT